ncbi:MAG: NAD(P)H-hydrate dehydratase [Bryobacteraceae bacterium]|jgi:NAD(P)H-hydrate epimerase
MKVLTAAQMREVDRRTIEAGIPGLVLMENAGHRVLEAMERRFAPLAEQRITVLCGMGNNGGDGLVIARQLLTRIHPRGLHVLLAAPAGGLGGDAAENYRMFTVAGGSAVHELTAEMRDSTLLVDALLGTGLRGPARGRSLELIRAINSGFPLARVVAVDLPSGMQSDSGHQEGDVSRADLTVTFTAPKPCHVLSPACHTIGELVVGQIGSPPELYEHDGSIWLALSGRELFGHLFVPRVPYANKGAYGHVLAIAGARGKAGAAGTAGVAALKAGAGLSTVASAASTINVIAAYAPEIMTEPLPETDTGSISARALEDGSLERLLTRKNVIACGPGLGTHPETVKLVAHLATHAAVPLVLDADALNGLAGGQFGSAVGPRVLTPHPGEMARLTGLSISEVEADRTGTARGFAQQHGVWLVLKGSRTLIAAPDGRVFVNPTGSPAMATGGTGDVLTGLLAGSIAQTPDDLGSAVLAAVWLHGRAGELAAAELGEKAVTATDLFTYLPEAMHECARLPHRF